MGSNRPAGMQTAVHQPHSTQIQRVSDRRRETRERLMDAAFDLAAERGLHRVSLREIAERAHFTRGAFHSNFESREQLFAAMIDRRTRRQLDAVERRVDEVFASEHEKRAQTRREQGRPPQPSPVDDPGTADIARLVVDVLSSITPDQRLTTVVSDFALNAQRDPAIARMFVAYQRRLEADVADFLERAVQRVGMRFTVPVEFAALVLTTLYDQNMVTRAIAACAALPDAQAVTTQRSTAGPPACPGGAEDRQIAEQAAALLVRLIEKDR